MPRQMDWIDTRIGFTLATGFQFGTDIDGGSTQVVQRGTTIIRTIIKLGMSSNSVAGAWGLQLIDMAIGIGDREAFSAGIFPDPNTDTDKPARGWMWRTSELLSQNGVGSPVVTTVQADIRGARKIDLGRAYIVFDNTAVQGTPFTATIRGLIRTLVKLA